MVRAATISLIYVTLLDCPEGEHNEAKAVTLMSTDVDRIVSGLELVHETWARLLEMAIGVWLLAQQMGAVSIAPVIVAIRKLWLVCIHPFTRHLSSLIVRSSMFCLANLACTLYGAQAITMD